jgi:hypothetical protein
MIKVLSNKKSITLDKVNSTIIVNFVVVDSCTIFPAEIIENASELKY